MSIARDFDRDGERLRVTVEPLGAGRYRVQVGGAVYEIPASRLPDGRVRFELDGRIHEAAAAPSGTGEAAARRGDRHVTVGGESWMLTGHTRSRSRGGHDGAGDGVIVAPMTGTVLKVAVRVGDAVAAGDTVAVVTAMKMEHNLLAGIDGSVAEVAVAEGATVDQDQLLIRIAAPSRSDSAPLR